MISSFMNNVFEMGLKEQVEVEFAGRSEENQNCKGSPFPG
jgi:hypothetical protein